MSIRGVIHIGKSKYIHSCTLDVLSIQSADRDRDRGKLQISLTATTTSHHNNIALQTPDTKNGTEREKVKKTTVDRVRSFMPCTQFELRKKVYTGGDFDSCLTLSISVIDFKLQKYIA